MLGARGKQVCARLARCGSAWRRSRGALGSSMLLAYAVGFTAIALAILGVLAMAVGGVCFLIRPLSGYARRLLSCSATCGAIGLAVGLGLFIVNVGLRGQPDDIGLVGDSGLAFLIGAGIGVPIFAIREVIRIGRDRAAA